MDRYMIVIPAKNRAFNMKCDDGDSMKLETLQKLVGGPIEPVNSVLSAEWAREKDVDGILLLVNEEGLMKERPLTNQRASEMTAAELVGPAVVAARRGDELIGFATAAETMIDAPTSPTPTLPNRNTGSRSALYFSAGFLYTQHGIMPRYCRVRFVIEILLTLMFDRICV